MRILGASGIDERLGRCVQVDAGVVQQVDQLNDHDRRQAPDLVLAKTIAGHVPTAALVVDAVSVLARILAKELQRYAAHRSALGLVVRKSVVEGKAVSVRVDPGGRLILNNTK